LPNQGFKNRSADQLSSADSTDPTKIWGAGQAKVIPFIDRSNTYCHLYWSHYSQCLTCRRVRMSSKSPWFHFQCQVHRTAAG